MIGSVDVIIPAFDRAREIETAIKSAQQSGVARVIVADDGSGDATGARSVELGAEVINTGGVGASAARSIAARAGSSEFILFLDSDDYLMPGAVEALLKDGRSEGLVTCGDWRWGECGSLSSPRVPALPLDCSDPRQAMSWLLGGFAMQPIHSYLFPRRLVEDAGFWCNGLSLNDDTEFVAQVLLRASRVRRVEDVVAVYERHNGDRISSGRSVTDLASLVLGIRSMRSAFRAFEFRAGDGVLLDYADRLSLGLHGDFIAKDLMRLYDGMRLVRVRRGIWPGYLRVLSFLSSRAFSLRLRRKLVGLARFGLMRPDWRGSAALISPRG